MAEREKEGERERKGERESEREYLAIAAGTPTHPDSETSFQRGTWGVSEVY